MQNSASSTIQAYYNSIESRLGYRLFLGGTRHFGYYFSETSWPWPIAPALRRMEAKLLGALECDQGARVLDAGCGVGHVALYMAQKGGLHVDCIDLTPHHIAKAAQNVQLAGAQDQVSVKLGDYHDLHAFEDGSFEGVYTMESLVHSTNTRKVLQEFLRVLKPGGRLVMHEYDHTRIEQTPKTIADQAKVINAIVGMPAFETFETDDLKRLARSAGFEDIELVDMSKNIVPMLWLFYIFAFIPYLLLKLLGLQYDFVNTTSGVAMYEGRKYWRYTQVRGKKPL
jgi:sterol 24-C-methyltransferase